MLSRSRSWTVKALVIIGTLTLDNRNIDVEELIGVCFPPSSLILHLELENPVPNPEATLALVYHYLFVY